MLGNISSYSGCFSSKPYGKQPQSCNKENPWIVVQLFSINPFSFYLVMKIAMIIFFEGFYLSVYHLLKIFIL